MKVLIWILVFLLLSGCQVVPLEPAQPESEKELPAVAEQPAADTQEPVVAPETEDVPAYEPVRLVTLGGIAVTAVDYDADPVWGPALTLELRNETTEDLLFSADYAKSDGVMCSPYWNCTVSAGETVRSQLFWFGEMLQKSGISALGELELELEICPNDDSTVVLFSETVSLSLSEEDVPTQNPPVWEDFTEQTLAAEDGFEIAAVGFSAQEASALTLYLHNRMETKLLCTATDVTVNGVPCDPEWGAVVMEDAVLYSELLMDAEPGDTVVMTLSVYNQEDWTAATLFSEEVTVILG